ncbi:MAG: sigma-54 dependent transcriptional regulator [Desulfatiglans sp.]|jgi:DNA-binding NtrC family response regulator|nr:sigma-54 dependent transcriptional regulator [Thermodesulfobacteriota bacterium]MEE4353249.1 sigma-54 dependent transcriptional regulator [Desulfatiglans sp.]
MESIPKNDTPILVVDDDIGLLSSIKATLVSAGMPEPAVVSDSRRVMEVIREHRFLLVFLDLIMPHVGGMDLLKQIKKDLPDMECIIVTAVDDVASAVEAMKYGAYDYLVKPLNSEKLIIVVNRALERYSLKRGLALFEKKQRLSDLQHPQAFQDMIVEDEAMALVFHQAEAVAPTDYSVVISGESGTGKEMLAQIIHKLSSRSNRDFLAVNMAAFSKALFEDEFFGHSKGAYTGASNEKMGFFETAQGGTLFLDEITELELSLQGKLLRVIQEGELYRLGSTKIKNIDVRIITATNRDINEEIEEGNFRADLFHRLNMCYIEVPPLRDRKRDILPLARHFLKKHAEKNQKEIHSIAPDLKETLLGYSFPGNVRELENLIASSILLEKTDTLSLSSVRGLAPYPESPEAPHYPLLPMAQMEKEHILRVLDAVDGNRTKAAKILQIGLRTLQRKLKLYSEPTDTPK